MIKPDFRCLLMLVCAAWILGAPEVRQELRGAPPKADETDEGFVSLFDGKSLAGWEADQELW